MESVVQSYVDSILGECSANGLGAVADYIPELAAADPDRFGICIASTDGYLYEAGDSRDPFTIQSISKPFTYALALADQGIARVDAKVGVEPSGDAFNEISLASGSGRPRNPMINAGAITAASLVAGATGQERFTRVLEFYGAFAGRRLDVDEDVFTSELGTAHRNRAIAAEFGKRFIAYEGGQHLVTRDVEFARRVQRDPLMGATYRAYLERWRREMGDDLVLYASTAPIGEYGAWGLREYAGQPTNNAPKLEAVRAFLKAHP